MSHAPLLTRPVGDRDGVVRSTLSGAHPRRLACALFAVDLIIVVTSAVVIRLVAPGMSSLTAALIVTAVLAVVVTILVWRLSGFRETGFTGPRTWQTQLDAPSASSDPETEYRYCENCSAGEERRIERDLRCGRRSRTDREGCLRPLPSYPTVPALGDNPRGGRRDLGCPHSPRATTPQHGLRARAAQHRRICDGQASARRGTDPGGCVGGIDEWPPTSTRHSGRGIH